MKIAIPTDNKKGLEDPVAEHFGRAKKFLIYDTETNKFEVFENPELKGKELPPDFLHRQGVKVVIVFGLGLLAYKKFKDYNVKMYKATPGTIAANLQKFGDGKLQKLKEEDIF